MKVANQYAVVRFDGMLSISYDTLIDAFDFIRDHNSDTGDLYQGVVFVSETGFVWPVDRHGNIIESEVFS